MQVLATNGKAATSNRQSILLDEGEDVNSVSLKGIGPGSIAFSSTGEHVYRLGTDQTWHEVVVSSSGGGSDEPSPAIYS